MKPERCPFHYQLDCDLYSITIGQFARTLPSRRFNIDSRAVETNSTRSTTIGATSTSDRVIPPRVSVRVYEVFTATLARSPHVLPLAPSALRA